MAIILWATAWIQADDTAMSGVAPMEIVFTASTCKAECGPQGLKFKAFIFNNSNKAVSLEKFALKTRLTLSYQPNKPKKNKDSKKGTPETYKTLSILPGGAFSGDSVHLNPGEIYGLERKLNLDNTQLDACSAKSVKVYGNIPIWFDNQEMDIAVNQDLKNNCDF